MDLTISDGHKSGYDATRESGRDDGQKSVYLDALLLIERLHRRFLDVLKAELDRLGRNDINNVQALVLYNIGEDEITIGELTNRGYYLGSNVSYNVKKLVENGYLAQERSPHDRRSIRVRLSEKGLELRNEINVMFDRHVDTLFSGGAVPADELKTMNASLRQMEQFWSEQVRFGG